MGVQSILDDALTTQVKCDTTNYPSIASIYVPHYEGDMGGDMLEHGDMKFSVTWSKKYAGQKFVHVWDKREPTLVS